MLEQFDKNDFLDMMTDYIHSLLVESQEELSQEELCTNVIEDFKNDEKYLDFVVDYIEETEDFSLTELRKLHFGILISYYYADTFLSRCLLTKQTLIALKTRLKNKKDLFSSLESVFVDEETNAYINDILDYIESPSTTIDDIYERFTEDDKFAQEIFEKIIYLAARADGNILDSHLYYIKMLFKASVISKYNPYFKTPLNAMAINEYLNNMLEWIYTDYLWNLNDSEELAYHALYEEVRVSPFIPFLIADFYIAKNAELYGGSGISESDYPYLIYIEKHAMQDSIHRFVKDEDFGLTVLKTYLDYYKETIEKRENDISIINQQLVEIPPAIKPFCILNRIDHELRKEKTKEI